MTINDENCTTDYINIGPFESSRTMVYIWSILEFLGNEEKIDYLV